MAGADSSIYSMIRQQPIVALENPLDMQAKRMQLSQMMGQGELQRFQLQEAQSGAQSRRSLQDLFRTNPNATPEQVGAIDYKAAQELRKSQLDTEGKRATLAKTQGETLKNALQMNRDRLSGVNDPPAAAQWITSSYEDPILGPVMKKMGTLEEFISRIPQDQQGFAQWKLQNGLGIEKAMEHTKPNYQNVNAGGTTVPRQMNPNAPGFSAEPILRTATIAEQETARHNPVMERISAGNLGVAQGNAAETRAEHGRVASRAAEAAGRDKFGPPQEVTGPSGTPQLVVQNKTNGKFHDANTLAPIAGIGPKVGETAQKQQIGVQNTRAAITEYRDALKSWDWKDIAQPNARARMGTVYNNMLLQAKEAFNLGVLNGPDYMILQEVITSPSTMRGGVTGKKALDDQAKKLEEIMGRIGQQITTTQTGTTTSIAPSGGGIKFLGFE